MSSTEMPPLGRTATTLGLNFDPAHPIAFSRSFVGGTVPPTPGIVRVPEGGMPEAQSGKGSYMY